MVAGFGSDLPFLILWLPWTSEDTSAQLCLLEPCAQPLVPQGALGDILDFGMSSVPIVTSSDPSPEVSMREAWLL